MDFHERPLAGFQSSFSRTQQLGTQIIDRRLVFLDNLPKSAHPVVREFKAPLHQLKIGKPHPVLAARRCCDSRGWGGRVGNAQRRGHAAAVSLIRAKSVTNTINSLVSNSLQCYLICWPNDRDNANFDSFFQSHAQKLSKPELRVPTLTFSCAG